MIFLLEFVDIYNIKIDLRFILIGQQSSSYPLAQGSLGNLKKKKHNIKKNIFVLC